jgi:hypothetical protein
MVQPLVKVKSLHKKTNKFKRHQWDRKIAVKVRAPEGGSCWLAGGGGPPAAAAAARSGLPAEHTILGRRGTHAPPPRLAFVRAGELEAAQGY